MKCNKCGSDLISLYIRKKTIDNKPTWKKLDNKEYCDVCDKMFVATKI